MRVQNLEILSLVRRELQREGFIKVLKVHIHPSCASGDMPRLQRIITQLGSEVMPSESEPLPWLRCSTLGACLRLRGLRSRTHLEARLVSEGKKQCRATWVTARAPMCLIQCSAVIMVVCSGLLARGQHGSAAAAFHTFCKGTDVW